MANITIDRGQASLLMNPKLLITYTLSDGESQVFLTQNAVIGANEVVVGAGEIKVNVVLIDGNINWNSGNPVAKSAFVSIMVPEQ